MPQFHRPYWALIAAGAVAMVNLYVSGAEIHSLEAGFLPLALWNGLLVFTDMRAAWPSPVPAPALGRMLIVAMTMYCTIYVLAASKVVGSRTWHPVLQVLPEAVGSKYLTAELSAILTMYILNLPMDLWWPAAEPSALTPTSGIPCQEATAIALHVKGGLSQNQLNEPQANRVVDMAEEHHREPVCSDCLRRSLKILEERVGQRNQEIVVLKKRAQSAEAEREVLRKRAAERVKVEIAVTKYMKDERNTTLEKLRVAEAALVREAESRRKLVEENEMLTAMCLEGGRLVKKLAQEKAERSEARSSARSSREVVFYGSENIEKAEGGDDREDLLGDIELGWVNEVVGVLRLNAKLESRHIAVGYDNVHLN